MISSIEVVWSHCMWDELQFSSGFGRTYPMQVQDVDLSSNTSVDVCG